MSTPKCKACGETDPLRFYSSINTYCKEHWKERVRLNRRRNYAHYQKYEKSRASRPDRVAARNAYTNSDSGRVASRKAKAAYKAKNMIKRRAHVAVNNAVRDGRLMKPSRCEECGSDGLLHGHHDDYAKPLDVRWLCTKCHELWHRENGPGKNGGRGMPVLRFVTKSGSVAVLGKFKSLRRDQLRQYVRTHELAWIEA